jgi:hypothetical protein
MSSRRSEQSEPLCAWQRLQVTQGGAGAAVRHRTTAAEATVHVHHPVKRALSSRRTRSLVKGPRFRSTPSLPHEDPLQRSVTLAFVAASYASQPISSPSHYSPNDTIDGQSAPSSAIIQTKLSSLHFRRDS